MAALAAQPIKRTNPWVILIVISLGFFMTLLDLTIVNIAIPNMIEKLHASLDDVLWVINAYALVLAVLLITCGRLGDLFGQRTLFFAGVALFTVASAACGLAPSPGFLIGFRAVQGVGAAMLMPQTLAILTMVFPPERRGAAFGIWGAVAGVATIAGPTLGGLLVTAFDWRYIFFINVPIGALVLVLTFILIPDLRTGPRHSFDITGVVLASLALLAICYALVEGQKYNWGTITSFISIPLLLVVGFVLLGLFLYLQARRQDGEPLVPFVLFRDRNFSLMNMVSGFIAIGMLGIFLPFSIYLQSVLGFSALKAGLTMAPASVIAMFVAPVAGRMSDRIGGKYILMSGLLLFAGGMGSIALIAQPNSAWYTFLAPQIVAGIRHRLHIRADDDRGHAQRQPDDGRGGIRRVQHDPPGRHGDRHRRHRRAAAEPAHRRLHRPDSAARSQPAARGARQAGRRIPVRGQGRPRSRLGSPGGRPCRRDLHQRIRAGHAADDSGAHPVPGRGRCQLHLYQADRGVSGRWRAGSERGGRRGSAAARRRRRAERVVPARLRP